MARRKSVTPEKSWQQTVKSAAAMSGWFCLHFPNAVINPSGWVDLICFRDGATLLLELKNETGTLGAKQIEMHETLAHYGHTVHVLRPQQSWDAILDLLRTGTREDGQ
jgi:hypothetical protein